jgi:hypothetical protein
MIGASCAYGWPFTKEANLLVFRPIEEMLTRAGIRPPAAKPRRRHEGT